VQLAGYTNADWAGNAAGRRSTSGYAFSIGSAAIAWSSKKQPTVALSSTEAEYRGAVVPTCEAIWLKRLLKDLHEEVSDPTEIYCDNLSSIQLAKNLVFHARKKHIEVHYHFIREQILSGEVELTHVSTNRQIADIFTKPLGLDKLRQFSRALGFRHLDVPNLRGRVPEPELEREPEAEREADRSEKAESESGVDFDMSNQPMPGRPAGQIRTHGQIKRTHGKRQDRDIKKAVKGKVLTGGLTGAGRKGRFRSGGLADAGRKGR
jgi:hypothetical protein